jgi:alpha-L-fucosidase
MGDTCETPSALGPTEEWLTDWMVRTCEFMDRYRPEVVYFDWWIQNFAFKPYLKQIAAYYYNRAMEWGKEVTINFKREAFPPGVGTFDVERGALTDISPVPWQTCTAIGKRSWGYTRDNEFKNSRQIICDLIDIVSKNGRMLLNVGPRADGTITEAETQVLKDLGAWMAVNGEGIHGASPWKWFSEGSVNAQSGFFMDGDEKAFTPEDFRFTYRGGFIYAFQMRPDGRNVTIRSLAAKGMYDFNFDQVQLLGSEEKLIWKRDGEGLHIFLPEQANTEFPLTFKIRMM